MDPTVNRSSSHPRPAPPAKVHRRDACATVPARHAARAMACVSAKSAASDQPPVPLAAPSPPPPGLTQSAIDPQRGQFLLRSILAQPLMQDGEIDSIQRLILVEAGKHHAPL